VDVRIGIVQTAKEIDVEVGDSVDREELVASIESALANQEGVMWLTDKRGRRVGVPVNKLAYVEIGPRSEERRVGFGAP
jgi:hypothetical protein